MSYNNHKHVKNLDTIKLFNLSLWGRFNYNYYEHGLPQITDFWI